MENNNTSPATPRFASNPCENFEELRQAVEAGREAWHRIGRKESEQDRYEAWLAVERPKWRSIEDRIWFDVFGAKTSKENCVLMVPEQERALIRENSATKLVLLENEWPYAMPDGVKHYTLWSSQSGDDENDPDMIRKRILETWNKFAKNENTTITTTITSLNAYTFMRNVPIRRSVPGIWHVHVFVKM